MIKSHGAKCHVIKGDRDNCSDECRKYVNDTGKHYANYVYNPYFYEKTKTYIYEIYENLGYISENIFLMNQSVVVYRGQKRGVQSEIFPNSSDLNNGVLNLYIIFH